MGMRSIDEVKEKILSNDSIKYEERTVEAIRDFSRCNLFLVGRSPLGAAMNLLSVKSDCPELGPVGGLLTATDFSTSASVLVIQQHRGQAVTVPPPGAASAKVDVMPDEDLEANH